MAGTKPDSRSCFSNGSFIELLGSPRVFIHDINTLPGFEKIIPHVDGIEKYDRATAVARPQDVVIVKTPPEREYLQWLHEVGLGTKNIVVLHGQLHETLPARIVKNGSKRKIEGLLGPMRGQAVLSPYYGGPEEQLASKHLGIPLYARPDLVVKFNSKINFKRVCREEGVPVCEDTIFTAKEGTQRLRRLLEEYLSQHNHAVIRGEFGASASTTYIFHHLDMDLINEIISGSARTDRFVVEPYYEKLSSPSSLWFITKEERIVRLKTSNQILDGEISHAGNEFPVAFNETLINAYSLKLAKRFRKEGFIGPFGFDYMETEQGMFATECNPRVTGAMYPWEIVDILQNRHGRVVAARTENIHLPRKGCTFKDLKEVWADYLYNGHSNEGVIVPFNVGPVSEGKVTVVGAHTSKEGVAALFAGVKASLRMLT